MLPEVYAKVAFRLKGIVEHALGGRNPAVSNVVRRAVGNDADIEIFLAQADPKLQASLTAADNCNPHFCFPPCHDASVEDRHAMDYSNKKQVKVHRCPPAEPSSRPFRPILKRLSW